MQASLRSEQLVVDEEQALLRLDHAREVWGDAVAPEHRGLMLAAWDSLDAGTESERFFRVLRQLLMSEDFRVNARAMGNRVMAVLQAMAITPELREHLLSVANDEWGCQDGATWCLSNLELNLLVWQVEHAAQGKDERALLRLGRCLWRQDAVDRFATRWALEHGREQEGSEVGLAFRVGLREPLDLPFRRQLETVLDDEALPEGEMLEQADAIRDAQRAARRGLMLELTIRAMEVGPEDPGVHVR
ncbi:NEL domain-containing protein [Pseudomonas kurunegalensis]|nr:NEL domain-containing protein [Pseudomonas kurunegalensis]MCE0910708.1 NEL domain-containing protein [Pseudomonas kurunegalensis]WJR57803.1 NEL domain-containing protein [Pseudomonas kurunegalensis]